MQLITGMLADAATVERGKLYIHGGGWDTIWAATIPTTHSQLALVLLIRVEYSEALTDLPLLIELIDEDDQPVGVRIEGKINVGHAAGTKPGWPVFVPQAIQFSMLQLPKIGGYSFRVRSGEAILGSIVFRVAPLSDMPGFQGLLPLGSQG
jgi:hypothetical protein